LDFVLPVARVIPLFRPGAGFTVDPDVLTPATEDPVAGLAVDPAPVAIPAPAPSAGVIQETIKLGRVPLNVANDVAASPRQPC
jgi:hypothetical protein